MIKTTIAISTIMFLNICLSWAQQQPFQIEGKIANLTKPAKIYIRYQSNGTAILDSATLNKGKFHFTGQAKQASKVALTLDHGSVNSEDSKDEVKFFLKGQKVTLSAKDSLCHAQIKGADKFSAQIAYKGEFNKLYDVYRISIAKLEKEMPKQDHKNKIFLQKTQLLTSAFERSRDSMRTAFIHTHPDEIFNLDFFTIDVLPEPAFDSIASLFEILNDEVKATPKGKKFAKKLLLLKGRQLGQPAPAFTSKDLNGQDISLSDFKGKFVLLEFWSSTCGSCLASTPDLLKAYNKFKDKNFTILGFSMDEKKREAAWRKAIETHHMSWPQACTLTEKYDPIGNLYGVEMLPTSYLIDPNGIIIAKNIHSYELAKKLEEYIK
ncbi:MULTISPECIES: TlpA disulfide reductase family protein [unclassified Sphingobacterium]|uniref:TlpA disulfide reductase family protein n=1 Tax=unclassified Sphingobacterium TaxID=2609468 RepID=UPI001051332F|nr:MULTISPECIES: TlpA disulfide reductase family protein [unclassified Sphingobacterium]MCS3556158.1 peroxiredoxin [Sphingobacterium sp. JUb21]TCR08534.1 peroxiredoxin [Sphingobacterium sp. JUb20]